MSRPEEFPEQPTELDLLLLDFHLNGLSEAQRRELAHRIDDDTGLSERNSWLISVFGALSELRPQPAPQGLLERICARVQAAPRLHWGLTPAPEGEDRGTIVPFSSLRNVIAIAAMIVLAIGLGVPSVMALRDRGQRAACAWNLAQLGRGVQAYASTFADSLPFVGWSPRASWRPTSDPGIEVLPNRRHLYPLLQGRLVQPLWFVCPSGSELPMAPQQVPLRDDFLEARNTSYAYQNMSGVRPTLRDPVDLPILSDDNPCFDEGLPLFEAAQRLGLHDPASANSRIHRGAGQNILTLDGRSKWTHTPGCGIQGDNIWTLQDVRSYTGREGPRSTRDAHLLK